MRQTFFSLAQSPRPSVPYYWRDLLIGGRYRYLHRRAVLYSFVLHLLSKKSSRRCDKILSVLPSLQGPQFPCCWCDLLIRGRCRYLNRRAVFIPFIFTFVICYKFRNVSVRKCRMVQLAKFLM